jgi:hypothetical protein
MSRVLFLRLFVFFVASFSTCFAGICANCGQPKLWRTSLKLIPNIAFVKLDVVTSKGRTKLLLECLRAVMFWLRLGVGALPSRPRKMPPMCS